MSTVQIEEFQSCSLLFSTKDGLIDQRAHQREPNWFHGINAILHSSVMHTCHPCCRSGAFQN